MVSITITNVLIRPHLTSLFSVVQVAIKNNVDVFYFACSVPMHVLFVEDGEMDKRVFLATWKEIPAANEVQYEIKDVQHNAGREQDELVFSLT